MVSEVDIGNLALSHIGDDATVSSLSPPEGSAQAGHVARFYPIARDAVLSMHDWNFNTRRIVGAQLTTPDSGWQYAYAKPNNALNVIAILPPDAIDDYTYPIGPATTVLSDGSYASPLPNTDIQLPQPFAMETDSSGTEIIVTNQEDATLRHTIRVTDTAKFPPLVVQAISHLTASYLAGPILKGKAGRAEARAQLAEAMGWLAKATEMDANQKEGQPKHNVSWLAGR